MTEQIYAFGSGDIQVQFYYGLQKEKSIICPVHRLSCKKSEDGFIDGIFELGTILYNDKQQDIFEDNESYNSRELIGSSEMNIVIFPKKCIQSLIRLDGVKIKSKQLIIKAPSNCVYIQYVFSNSSDWEEHQLALPPIQELFNPDPLYRIGRALEDIKKILGTSQVNSSDDIILSIEEYTDLKLNGRVPKRYANFEE